ncbi:MAG: crossover junction endodeoxyribonuclease RuvC [Candidatus Aminicenantes bacterium]|nr:crossover junction endodeoxyribonuclease RuvC [Candidatus Aminicenantes bacterium]
MRILGLDPSLRSTGYGLIDCLDQGCSSIEYGTIKPPAKLPFYKKINTIRVRIEELILSQKPDEVAIENVFFAHNVKTALILGQVRGAVLVAVASLDVPLFEYSALEIKKAVTSYGQADKNQVSFMVRTLLNLGDAELPLDASDALATAICHSHSQIFNQKLQLIPSEGKGK